ncbi:MAG: SIS domain-containing protein [Lachnospiraceae bacterium]|nr:SIS domain-containing protein [Lachnospiraceae bacterium]
MDYRKDITEYIELEREVLSKLDVDALNEAMQLIEEAYRNRKKVYIFGNGGSSATASHYQNDFNKGLSETLETKFEFVCLNNDTATLMAIANDMGFEEVFRYQLQGRIREGDLVIALSGSGNSANIMNAVRYAKEQGNKVIGLTGIKGGKLMEEADVSLHVPVNSMQVTEDVHMIFDHLMVSVFYKHLCGLDHMEMY